MRELLPSVLTPLHWLEALASSSPPTLLAPAKSKENKKENEERMEITESEVFVEADSSSTSHLLDILSNSYTLFPLHAFSSTVSARHTFFGLQFDSRQTELLWPAGWGSLCLSPSLHWFWCKVLSPAELIPLTEH